MKKPKPIKKVVNLQGRVSESDFKFLKEKLLKENKSWSEWLTEKITEERLRPMLK